METATSNLGLGKNQNYDILQGKWKLLHLESGKSSLRVRFKVYLPAKKPPALGCYDMNPSTTVHPQNTSDIEEVTALMVQHF